MKRFILSIFAMAVMVTTFYGCSDDKLVVKPGPDDETELPEPEKDPSATIKLAQSALTIAGTLNDFNEVTVESNQRQFTVSVEMGQDWLGAEVEGVILRATALSSNTTGSTRSAVVTIVAGTGENTATTTITVSQTVWDGVEQDATLTLTPSQVTVDAEISKSATITMTSNKDIFTATVPSGVSWLKAEINGNTLTVTTLETNNEESTRSCTVTVVAGETKTATEQLAVTQKGFSLLPTGTEIGALYEGGIVVFKDETVVKVLSLMASEKISWAVAGTESFIGIANTNADGAANMAMIKTAAGYPDNFPAAKFCADMGNDWFLPSRGEYAYVTVNYVEINKFIEQYQGGAALTADYIWSSNEDPEGKKAFAYRLTDKGAAAYSKSGARMARCMKNVAVK